LLAVVSPRGCYFSQQQQRNEKESKHALQHEYVQAVYWWIVKRLTCETSKHQLGHLWRDDLRLSCSASVQRSRSFTWTHCICATARLTCWTRENQFVPFVIGGIPAPCYLEEHRVEFYDRCNATAQGRSRRGIVQCNSTTTLIIRKAHIPNLSYLYKIVASVCFVLKTPYTSRSQGLLVVSTGTPKVS
jgi:hypothetical protein